MSSFAGDTPVVMVVLENPFSGGRYPTDGSTTAVVDTGYDGFAAVPPHVFEALSLDEVAASRRSVRTADGREVESRLALSSILLPDLRTIIDGQIETLDGLSEILLGTAFLSRFSLSLDYCLGAAQMRRCK